jgi:hypothetical protein
MAINVKDKLVTLESLGVAYSAEQDAREEADQALSTRIDNIVAPDGDPSLTDVSDARMSGSTTYNTLKARLDADKAAIGTEISQLSADLGDLSDLETESNTDLVSAINEAARSGLSDEVKEAILACFRNVPWIDGDSCYANLEAVFGVVRYEWTYPSQNVIMLHAGASPNMNNVLSRATLADSEARRTIVYTYGEAPYYYNGEASNYYPIPVPADATKVKVEMPPSNEYVYMHTVRLNGSAYGDSIVDNRVTWTQLTNGVLEKTITNPGNLFLMLNIKYDNSNSAFPSEPSRVKITFIKGE